MYVLYVNGKIPLEFLIGREYDAESGYLALTKDEDSPVLICRIIPEKEQVLHHEGQEEI